MSAGDADEAHTAPGTQRLDKWLWFARFTKTRTLAAAIVTAGKARINRVRVDKPAQTVRAGDVLTLNLNRRIHLVRVLGLAERRGPSAAARALYEELTAEGDVIKPQPPSAAPIAGWQPGEVRPVRRPVGSGRPTKKERRDLDRLSGKDR
ncbi:MAG: RNA-binding S4 domain-containing protein [Hyphomicrobium sp.]